MSSETNISHTSVSVLMINAEGVMVSVDGNDYFLSYNRAPWFRQSSVEKVLNVKMSGRNAIEWPEIGVELEIDSLQHPERYPLVMRG